MKKILIADDEEVNQFFLRKLVSESHIEVHTAPNGEVAVEMAKENNFDLIFMDIYMPQMNGIAALGQIRAHEKETAHQAVVVAVTSNSAKEEHHYKSMGFDECLFNPIPLREVQHLLKKYQISLD